jgi:hypothetical protein
MFREAQIFRNNCDEKGVWDLVAMSGPWDKRLGGWVASGGPAGLAEGQRGWGVASSGWRGWGWLDGA